MLTFYFKLDFRFKATEKVVEDIPKISFYTAEM